jgi:hypothetical protein
VDNYPKDNWSDFLGFTKQEIAPVEPINKVVKRDGRVQSYDSSRIFSAIRKAIKATRGAEDLELEKELTVKVEVAIKKLMDERSKETYPCGGRDSGSWWRVSCSKPAIWTSPRPTSCTGRSTKPCGTPGSSLGYFRDHGRLPLGSRLEGQGERQCAFLTGRPDPS